MSLPFYAIGKQKGNEMAQSYLEKVDNFGPQKIKGKKINRQPNLK